MQFLHTREKGQIKDLNFKDTYIHKNTRNKSVHREKSTFQGQYT